MKSKILNHVFNSLFFFLGSLIFFSPLAIACGKDFSPAGYWQTIDDKTNQPRSIVKICANDEKVFFGRIIQVNYVDKENPKDTCEECDKNDPRFNQQILGMTFLTNMKMNPINECMWDNGEVLDPKNGKVYHAQMLLSPNGQELTLRGYIGIPLFGRNQTWKRIPADSLNGILGKPIKKYDSYIQTSLNKYLAFDYKSCIIPQKKEV